MADNYLEKKMEEHRAGTKHYRPKTTPSGASPGLARFKIPSRRVLLSFPEKQIIENLVNTGMRVAFTGGDKLKGQTLAQKTGALFHPGNTRQALDYINKKWGTPEILILSEQDNAVVEAFKEMAAQSKYARIIRINHPPVAWGIPNHTDNTVKIADTDKILYLALDFSDLIDGHTL